MAIEKQNGQVDLSLYRPAEKFCGKSVVAKYMAEGGDPSVDSLFFVKLKGEINVFTIVHWDINSRGIGTFGKLYQVYAYRTDSSGRLMENEEIVGNGAMTGITGYQEGAPVLFLYTTSAAVKNFLACGRKVCH